MYMFLREIFKASSTHATHQARMFGAPLLKTFGKAGDLVEADTQVLVDRHPSTGHPWSVAAPE